MARGEVGRRAGKPASNAASEHHDGAANGGSRKSEADVADSVDVENGAEQFDGVTSDDATITDESADVEALEGESPESDPREASASTDEAASGDETGDEASDADAPYVDPDPDETAEWLESLRYVLKSKGPERVSYLLSVLGRKSVSRRRRNPLFGHHALHQHDPGRQAAALSRAIAKSNAASRASSAGTRWRWSSGRTRNTPASAATSRLMPPPPRCMKSPSITSSTARATTFPATRFISRGTLRRVSIRGHFSKAG